jgi:type I restriction enzyme, S subunit
MNIDRTGRLDLTVVKYVSADNEPRLHSGDVLFNNTNSAELIGKTTFINTEMELAFSNHMTRVRSATGINARFVAYQLHFLWMMGYFRHRCTHHVNQASISSSTLADTVPLIIAPTNEQQRIVDEIEKQFTRLDAAVAALNRVQANLKRYRASVLKAACEGRLVPTEAELARREGRPYEPASVLIDCILADRHAAVIKPNSDGTNKRAGTLIKKRKDEEPSTTEIARPSQLPEGWVWSSLGQLFDVYVGATPSRPKSEYWGGDIPWVSSGEVDFCRILETREKITKLGFENSSTKLHPPGTVLLGMIGEGKTRGQTAILDIAACNNQNSAAIRVSETPIPPEYVYRVLEGEYERTRRLASGGNQPALNKLRVKAILIPVPPLAEIHRIVAEVDKLLSIIDELGRQASLDTERAERLRQSILKRAFDGKLVSQDPNDEPASALLERIRGTAISGGAPVRAKSNKPSRQAPLSRETVNV